jgi:hypothetical protein
MAPCCHNRAGSRCAPRIFAPQFTHIETRWAVEWKNLRITVSDASSSCTVGVQASDTGKMLYNAQRSTVAAAKLAGVEFATFHTGSATAESPERLIRALVWRQQY